MSRKAKLVPCRTLRIGWMGKIVVTLSAVMLLLALIGAQAPSSTSNNVSDPGVRQGSPGAGSPIPGLTPNQLAMFTAGMVTFSEIDSVSGTIAGTGSGLGPRFNAESCAQCHAAPAIGGSSPSINPQIAAATDQNAGNQIPFFITPNGPVREARFPFASNLRTPDGGVHDLFTISGRSDAQGCSLTQPDFQTAANNNNLIFRIPTPAFGGGLIEAIPDSAIVGQMKSSLTAAAKLQNGIAGRVNTAGASSSSGDQGTPNTSGNDGTITRFGWKAQNKSLEIFAGEAYNVEMGVTNELFPNKRDETPGCVYNGTPEDQTNFDKTGTDFASDIVHFAAFMRFLDQPQPAPATPSTTHGEQVFQAIGCALCHNPSFVTGKSSVAALSNVTANLYSDLLLHHMGPRLADNIKQGAAAGDEFRTAPLWGLGQRIFFVHDGRTNDLVKAIAAHASSGNGQYPSSESNAVIKNFQGLSAQDQQDLLNFLRSL
ncbi:MAG TPA: di-heme oxidoredictase family protein [Candidatus Sulfotelmatobacter sp.]|nr:di-heme oxidoredictase family protein [Candidatus Sulfotelmatobacter sp.]